MIVEIMHSVENDYLRPELMFELPSSQNPIQNAERNKNSASSALSLGRNRQTIDPQTTNCYWLNLSMVVKSVTLLPGSEIFSNVSIVRASSLAPPTSIEQKRSRESSFQSEARGQLGIICLIYFENKRQEKCSTIYFALSFFVCRSLMGSLAMPRSDL